MRENKTKFNILLLFSLLYTVTPSYFSLLGTKAQILLMFLATVMLLFFGYFKFPKVNRTGMDRLLHITYIWAIAMAVISLLYRSSYGVITYIIPWLIIVPFLIKEVNTKKRFIRMLDALVFISVIVAILGIFEEVTGINVFEFLNTDSYFYDTGARLGYTRIYSFTAHPITYSLYCMFIMAFIFYRLSLPETKKRGYFLGAYIVVFVSAVCTFSRSSIILILISQIVLLWLCGYRNFVRKMLKYSVLAIVAVAIVSVAFPKIGRMISEATVLVLAVFSDNYAQQLRALGYQWDTSGVANRFELWGIVFSQMNGHWLLGHGPSTTLTNVFLTNSAGNKFEKTSIEVQPLLTLFRYGIVAVFLEELRNVIQIKYAYKFREQKGTWEGKISYNKVCMVVFIFYFLALITVNQTDTIRIYMILSCLFISYNKFNFFDY